MNGVLSAPGQYQGLETCQRAVGKDMCCFACLRGAQVSGFSLGMGIGAWVVLVDWGIVCGAGVCQHFCLGWRGG